MKGSNARHLRQPGNARIVRGIVGVLVLTAALAGASSALARSYQNEYAPFAHCPLGTPGISLCLASTVTGGEFKMGSTAVPIEKTVTLQGGLKAKDTGTRRAHRGQNPLAGTLTVPGGLVGVEGVGGEVTATAELAGVAHINLAALFSDSETLVELPVKVKLDNPALGEECYIGSDSEPVTLDLTVGKTDPPPPNEPIQGSNGTRTSKDEVTTIEGAELVDNSFAVPGVSGCGGILAPVLDLAVDVKAGLPSAAGHNLAIMKGTLLEAEARLVRTEQEIPQFGRCNKVTPVKNGKVDTYGGRFTEAGCVIETAESPEPGKYEWAAGPGPDAQFSGALGRVTFETIGAHKVVCASGSDSGEITGQKTEKLDLALSGCETGTHEPCRSMSAGAGDIDTALTGTLGFVNDSEGRAPAVGLDLRPESGSRLATLECGGTEELLEGGAIAPVSSPDKMLSTLSLKLKELRGLQAPRASKKWLRTRSARRS